MILPYCLTLKNNFVIPAQAGIHEAQKTHRPKTPLELPQADKMDSRLRGNDRVTQGGKSGHQGSVIARRAFARRGNLLPLSNN
jgi:hypothetical protein